MPSVYILIGLPGSGKSTWCDRHFAANPGVDFVTISSDAMVEEFAAKHGITYDEAHGRLDWKSVNTRMKYQFRAALKDGKDVIVDRTNMSKKARKLFLKDLPEGYERVAVNFQITDQELRRRLDARAAVTGKSIPDDVLKNMSERYVAPDREEFDRIIRVTQ